jgi:hypothetical protein
MPQSGPDQRGLAAPRGAYHQQHCGFGAFSGGSQQLSEFPGLAGSAEEHPMLLDVKRAQPRERRPIILPPKTPRSIEAAQRLSKPSRDSLWVPGQVKMLQISQQRMSNPRVSQDRNQGASP